MKHLGAVAPMKLVVTVQNWLMDRVSNVLFGQMKPPKKTYPPQAP